MQPLVCVRPNTWRAPRSDSDGAQLPGYIRNPGALCGGTWQTALRTLRSDGVPSSRSSRGSQPHGRRATSRSTTVASLVPATRAPRGPRPKQTRMSKEELAESRWTVTQLADRWWGFDSANALLLRSEVVMEEDSVRVRHFDTAISSSGWTPTLKVSEATLSNPRRRGPHTRRAGPCSADAASARLVVPGFRSRGRPSP